MTPTPRATDAPPSFGYVPGERDTGREAAHLETARRYLAAIEAGTGGEGGEGDPADVYAFFTPDVLQEEFPNRLVPDGARRDLDALREAGKRGRKVMRSQRYEVRAAYAMGDTVILETLWVGTLAMAIGNLPEGGEMRAHFAVFLDFRDGRIYRQRNYDCFEPF